MHFNEQLEQQLAFALTDAAANHQVKKIRDLEEENTSAEFANALETLNGAQQLYILRVLKKDEAAEVFSYLDDDIKASLALSFTEDWGLNILNELQSDELADVLEDLPVNLMRKILSVTDEEKRKKINNIFQYDENQIGSIMSVDISVIKSEWTAKKALRKIRKDYKNKKEMSHHFYVVNDDMKFLGDISLEDIVFANEEAKIDELYDVSASVLPEDDKEKAALIFSEQDQSTLPVVSRDNYIIGMITADDVIDVIQEEATEDMYRMVGINPEAAEDSYLKTSIMQIVKSRVFWLLILMISATLSQFIIQQFTEISSNFINEIHITVSTGIIVGLIPIISGSAGNAGSQSSTTITRAAALGEIKNKDLSKVIGKEVSVGVVIGFIMFFANIVRLYLYFTIPDFRRDANGNEAKWSELSFIIIASSLSLFIVIVFAKFLGTIIPIIAVRFKKDPAVMSAPILATLSDAISTLIFFGLNILVLWVAHKGGIIGNAV
ncbi:magnesium transporter [Mycoplasma buteonis]|uniref:magnesium transporter n=1 Tax=Mycoplasma buteonis TaxID=171280 RepID=UPI00068FB87B|nr:magnesium transporter [Mycoplasma buteonis]